MAARCSGQDRLSDELPARTPGGAALFPQGDRESVSSHLTFVGAGLQPGHRETHRMSDSQKTAVIFGLANKRSIAWAIAQKLQQAGWRLAITYQNERLALEAKDLIADLPSASGFMCD